MSASGKVRLPRWNERDNLLFQLNWGDGLGRYVNDLDTEGGQDAVFDPETGRLEPLGVFAGYLAYQHWWRGSFRSTFVYSYVAVDNLEFQPDDAYRRTERATVNLLWSPIPNLDLGVELLWGARENKDGQRGTATQFQLATAFRFY